MLQGWGGIFQVISLSIRFQTFPSHTPEIVKCTGLSDLSSTFKAGPVNFSHLLDLCPVDFMCSEKGKVDCHTDNMLHRTDGTE